MKSERPVAIITGGAAGLGLAIAREFLAAGFDVLIVSRDAEKAGVGAVELANQFPQGPAVQTVAADVTGAAGASAAMAACDRHFGRLDVLVNCVGASDRGTISELSLERLDELMSANVHAALLCSQAALPMLRRSRGAIVNIGSLASKVGARYVGGYAIAKHALAGLSQQLRLELKPEGIHVALVCPGPILRADASLRYRERLTTSLPEEAAAPGAGAKLRGLDPQEVAKRVVRCAQKRLPEAILPRHVRLLITLGQAFPKLGDALLLRFTSSRR